MIIMPNKELPQRKNTRLPEYDYSQKGAYFITVCTHNRRKILSDVVGALHEAPVIRLKYYGKIADGIINSLSDRFNIKIPSYVIMPDHIHLIIVIENGEPLRAIHESPLRRHRSILSKVMGYLKMNVSKEIHMLSPSEKIWQRSFYDHIVRNEDDLKDINDYIVANPFLWACGNHDDSKYLR